MTLVSVVIPAYNQSQFLADAVHSVLCQTLDDLEVIVVDDGSTDDTAQVASGIRDPRVRYIYQENRGLSAARNTGIRASTGKYLSFLDCDDLFAPSKLEWLTRALEERPDAGLAAGQAVPIDEEGGRVGAIFDTPPSDDPSKLLLGNPLHVGSVLLVKEWQERVGYFDEDLRSYEDWDLWLRLACAGCRFEWVPKPVSLYRFHLDQMTRIGTQMTTSTFAVLDKFFARPDVTPACLDSRDFAYSRAHLRGAAQAWRVQDSDRGGAHLLEAVKLNPALMEDGGRRLADHFRSWTDLPKITDPLGFLEAIYSRLPAELSPLAGRRRTYLARAAAHFAHQSHAAGDLDKARRLAWKAIGYRPAYLADRSLVALLRDSLFRRTKSEVEVGCE